MLNWPRMRFRISLDLALMGAVAFVCACVAHEALGHGGVCWLTGGHVVLLTSVYFRCQPGLPIIDAAGPLTNLIVAGFTALAVSRYAHTARARVLGALILAFNAMWGAGYLVYSACTNDGDWAFVLRDLDARPLWLWRILFAGIGFWIYLKAMGFIAPHLPSGALLLSAYIAAGAVALGSVMLNPGSLLPALLTAAEESLLASVGLLYLALARRDRFLDREALAGEPARPWLVTLGLLLVAVFLLSLGRGYSAA
jgi:hypothetical protein